MENVGSGVSVITDRYNRLVKRRELKILVNHPGTGTPSRREIAEKIRVMLNIPEQQVVIVKKIRTEYGLGRSDALVYIYEEVNRAKQFEPPHILKKHGLAEAGEKTAK